MVHIQTPFEIMTTVRSVKYNVIIKNIAILTAYTRNIKVPKQDTDWQKNELTKTSWP
jgi:hypothetical protein